jgi:NitT/TauT family transport system substrate-binding protein
VISNFLQGIAEGWAASIADPEAVIPMLIERNPAADADLELRRLQLSIEDNVATDWVMENGFGIIDEERMANSIAQIATTYEFVNEPDASLYFTSAYLPEGGFSLAE